MILTDVVLALQEAVDWLNRTGLIKHMLRANLHQRQYALAVRASALPY